jgi:hypothetical protein
MRGIIKTPKPKNIVIIPPHIRWKVPIVSTVKRVEFSTIDTDCLCIFFIGRPQFGQFFASELISF